MLKRSLFAAPTLLLFALSLTAAGQEPPAAPENAKTRPTKGEIIDLINRIGRMPAPQRNSRMDIIWKDTAASKTPRSDFMFCVGLAYLGDHRAQACVGNAYEKGIGVVEDLSEAYTWYALALEGPVGDKESQQRVQEAKEHVVQRLQSSYPAPSDEDLGDMVKAQESRIARYREEAKKGGK